jgi:hypothetical protein
MDEIVAAAKARGYRTKYKIDSKNNSQYGIITKDGNSLELRYEDKDRAGGVRTHVGSLMKDFPGTVDEVLDWYEEQLANRNRDCTIADYVVPRLDAE